MTKHINPIDLEGLILTSDDGFTAFRFEWLERIALDDALPPSASRVAIRLATKYLNRKMRIAWPAQSTLARELGLTVRGIQKVLGALADRGHLDITVRKGHDSNIYRPILKAKATNEDTNACSERHEQPFRETRTAVRMNPFEEPYDEPIERQDIPEADASGASGREVVNAGDEPKAPYRQSVKAANHALHELQQKDFPIFGDDPAFDTDDRSGRGVVFHWHRLLRGGLNAADIVAQADRVLADYRRLGIYRQRPSLGGFLARFEYQFDAALWGTESSGEHGGTMLDLAEQFERRAGEVAA